jgi:hypothetical protein
MGVNADPSTKLNQDRAGQLRNMPLADVELQLAYYRDLIAGLADETEEDIGWLVAAWEEEAKLAEAEITRRHRKQAIPAGERFPTVDKAFIDQVKSRVSIENLVAQAGVQLRRNGATLSGKCQWHDDRDPSFKVWPNKGRYRCYGACNRGGDAVDFVMWTRSLDFIAALKALAEVAGVPWPERREIVPVGSRAESVDRPYYELRADGIYYVEPKTKMKRSGEVYHDPTERRVTNFACQITTEIQANDGDNITTLYDLAGKTDRSFSVPQVSSEELADERKLVARLLTFAGGRAIVYRSGAGHLRPAIQEMSNGFLREQYYTATGWYNIGGERVFLTPGANLARMEVPHEVKRYCIVADPGNLAAGLATVKMLLEVFPHHISYICAAHAFLPPLYRWIPGMRYALHLVGQTGVYKTTYAERWQSLYGPFVNNESRLGWRSTVNHLEMIGWHCKDVLILIDDYKPRYVKMTDLTTFIHNYADNRARGRLRRDSTAMNSKPVRGIVISTGEDMPAGEASVMSRMIIVRVPKDAIDIDLLSATECKCNTLPAVMAEYLRWLPETLDVSRVNLWRDQYTRQLAGSTNPGRIALNMAQNRMAWTVLGDFLTAHGAWTESERLRADAEYQTISLETIRGMATKVDEEKAASVFSAAVKAMLAAGEAVILPRNESSEPPLGKTLLGWQDDDGVYLIGDAAYHAVEKWLRQEGRSIGFTSQAVWEQFAEDKKLTKGIDGRPSRSVRIGGTVKRIVHLCPGIFEDEEEAPF